MIDIQNEEYYDLYMSLRTIYNTRMRELMNIRGRSLPDRFRADKRMIEIIDKQFLEDKSRIASLDSFVKEYNHDLKSLNIRDWIVEKGKFYYPVEYLKLLILIILTPVYLIGLINNYIAYIIPSMFTKKVKDVQFHSSIKFVLGMIVFPLYYTIISVLAALFIPGALFSWLYILCIPISGIFAYRYFIWMKKSASKFRFLRHMNKVAGKSNDLTLKREKILTFTDEIILNHLKPA